MSPERQAKITTALSSCPDGSATARQLAVVLGWKETAASFNLGILYFAKVVDRENIAENTRQYRYWIMPVIVPLPAPEPWRPLATRIAKIPRHRIIAALAAEADALSDDELV